MPVFLGRVTVAGYVTDEFAVNLGCGVKTEGNLDVLVLQVTVDGLGHANHLDACIMCLVVLGQNCSVSIAVVTTDDYHSSDFELAQDLEASLELLGLLQLGTA